MENQEEIKINKAGSTKGKGKVGRNKRKASRKGSPISLYVRDKISAHQYFAATNQGIKTNI